MSAIPGERAIWLSRNVLPHEPALRAWLGGRRLNGLEVDDIIQETYARLITAESVLHIRNVRSYLFQTAGSVVIDQLRRMKVVPIATVADLDMLGAASDQPSPELQTIDRDELARLAAAIAGLPARVREVFVLRRVHGLSQREVGVRLGIAQSTVEKHMSRGFLLLLERFTHGGNAVALTSNPKSVVKKAPVANGKKDSPRN